MATGLEHAHGVGVRSHLAQYLREHSVAPSTLSKYRRHFDQWLTFCRFITVDASLRELSTSDAVNVLSAFILDRAGADPTSDQPLMRLDRRSTTILGMLHGIQHYFKAASLEFPASHPQIRMLVKGLSYFDAPPRAKAPVSLSLLEACFRRLNFSTIHDQALWGVLCMAYFFLLRRSEIVAERTTFKWFALRGDDVQTFDMHGMTSTSPSTAVAATITLHGSKTQQGGPSVTRSMTQSGHKFICPVFGALLLKRCHGSLPGSWPASTFAEAGSVGMITTQDVAGIIKEAATDIGAAASDYGTHSLRIGGATPLYRAGVDTTTIQFQGRWVSDTFRRYTRLTTDISAKLAPSMISGSAADTTLEQRAATLRHMGQSH